VEQLNGILEFRPKRLENNSGMMKEAWQTFDKYFKIRSEPRETVKPKYAPRDLKKVRE
jgi:hypothetical protein